MQLLLGVMLEPTEKEFQSCPRWASTKNKLSVGCAGSVKRRPLMPSSNVTPYINMRRLTVGLANPLQDIYGKYLTIKLLKIGQIFELSSEST
ncbi:hypothetical protein M8J77_012457 [Diaphorina citri]|nr:hypothetical protein M8J77_012457 [Diaphorina citri]